MPELIQMPSRVEAAGTKPKLIDEYVGRVNTGEERISIARMQSPEGWEEPGQRPEFDEYTVVIDGAVHVEHEGGETDVRAGQAILVRAGEWVRYSTPEPGGAHYVAAGVLALLDPVSATRLVRAFSTYFYLVNVAEQVHRGRELQEIRARDGTWMQQAIDRVQAAGHTAGEVAADLRQLNLRPVFTAHPTEAARRSVLTKLRRIATLLDDWERAFGPDGLPREPGAERRVRRRLEELVDLMWQTDELRVVRPEPIDEARNAVYYFDALHHDAVPHTLEALGEELARIGVELPVDARPLTFGTWIGGDRDGNPNVTPQATLEVIALQHDHPIRDALDVVDDLRRELSSSIRITR